jgi:Phospholipase_D-nuclease N-terminal
VNIWARRARQPHDGLKNERNGHELGRISYAEFEFLFFNCAILAGWPLLSLVALGSLRGRGLAGAAQAIWVLIIVAVPFLGALAYLIVRPSDRQPPHTA